MRIRVESTFVRYSTQDGRQSTLVFIRSLPEARGAAREVKFNPKLQPALQGISRERLAAIPADLNRNLEIAFAMVPDEPGNWTQSLWSAPAIWFDLGDLCLLCKIGSRTIVVDEIERPESGSPAPPTGEINR